MNKSLVVPIAAALVIGAILGGAAGAGVAILVSGANTANGQTSTHAGVVVNDTSRVNSITGVVAKAEPSVVTLSVTGGSSSGTGSGVVLTSDGYVLTNNHVATLDGATAKPTIKVQDSVGHIYDATIVGTDPTVDLAVVKLQGASGLTPIEWGDSSKLNVGDTTIAMGAPLGLAGTVTTGIVSALNRSIQIASSAVPDSSSQDNQGQLGSPFNFDFGNGTQQQTAQTSISIPVVQTDAAINPGNSGGALLDANGRLIGINVAIASAGNSSGGQSGSIGVGFALPANLAKRVSDEIIKTGKASHGMLGASVSDSAAAKNSKQVGALLQKIANGSAASKAGLAVGDIIIDFNGIPISDASDLTAAVRTYAAGSKVELTYIRGGNQKTVTVTLDALTVK
jgi:putative serine protease PepD